MHHGSAMGSHAQDRGVALLEGFLLQRNREVLFGIGKPSEDLHICQVMLVTEEQGIRSAHEFTGLLLTVGPLLGTLDKLFCPQALKIDTHSRQAIASGTHTSLCPAVTGQTQEPHVP
jgi:hypothetical protein